MIDLPFGDRVAHWLTAGELAPSAIVCDLTPYLDRQAICY